MYNAAQAASRVNVALFQETAGGGAKKPEAAGGGGKKAEAADTLLRSS
jgi:hypothetical protein